MGSGNRIKQRHTNEQFLEMVEYYYKDWEEAKDNLKHTTLNLIVGMLGMFHNKTCWLTTVYWGANDVVYVKLVSRDRDPQVVFGSDLDKVERDVFDLPFETMASIAEELHDVVTHRTV